ncbi:hypothetical protein, partial [Parabacteroides johnsonii]
QQTLWALTPVTALNAHQLRPEVEPDGSFGMADSDSSFASPCGARGRKRTVGIGHPKRKQSFL